MRINPTTLTINQLFNNISEQFFIPAYQRRYAWEWKQTKELFDDINNLKNGDSHLLGNIVCLTDEHTAGINQLEVVDGQQRLTTLSLFLKALRQHFDDVFLQATVLTTKQNVVHDLHRFFQIPAGPCVFQ